MQDSGTVLDPWSTMPYRSHGALLVGRPVPTHAHPYQISLNGVQAGQAGTGASVVDGRSALYPTIGLWTLAQCLSRHTPIPQATERHGANEKVLSMVRPGTKLARARDPQVITEPQVGGASFRIR